MTMVDATIVRRDNHPGDIVISGRNWRIPVAIAFSCLDHFWRAIRGTSSRLHKRVSYMVGREARKGNLLLILGGDTESCRGPAMLTTTILNEQGFADSRNKTADDRLGNPFLYGTFGCHAGEDPQDLE